MKIFPAIDIIGGRVVRLLRGDYDKVKNYSLSCVDAAISFKERGAGYIHAVDLDGAKSGFAENAQAIEKIIASSGLFVEVGGGIRTEKQIESYLAAGAGRVILGTAAVKDFEFTARMAKIYPAKIAVGVDAVDGKVAINGWREVTDLDSFDFCRRLYEKGVEYVIYTDISRDGALSGTNMEAYERLKKIDGLNITASGGITFIDEIKRLKEMDIYGAILGKALYEGKLDLVEALASAEGKDAG